MNTVNVIEMVTDTMQINLLKAFPDDENGNKEAEALFKQLALKNGAEEWDLDPAIDDGYFEMVSYYLCIVHSSAESDMEKCKWCGSDLTGTQDPENPPNNRPYGFCSNWICPYNNRPQESTWIEE
jgi:hypothetical protein